MVTHTPTPTHIHTPPHTHTPTHTLYIYVKYVMSRVITYEVPNYLTIIRSVVSRVNGKGASALKLGKSKAGVDAALLGLCRIIFF